MRPMVTAGLIAAVVMAGQAAEAERRQSPDPAEVYSVALGASPRKGGPVAKVTIVYACEYASPFCERIRATFDELQAPYGDDLAIVHKHTIVHPDISRPAALAACAAHRQGKFWAMDALIWERVWPS